MKSLKPIPTKKASKHEREKRVLLGLVDHYLKTGKPVGSNTLKDAGFDDLSSATIRNYCAKLEEDGFLTQQHTSGGRIPTHKALRFYAEEHQDSLIYPEESAATLEHIRTTETKEIAAFLQHAAEELSRLTNTAVFLSAPRFDHDFITAFRLVPLDNNRLLCIVVTDFGAIHTELVPSDIRVTAFVAKRIEDYFHWRLTGLDKPIHLEPEEELFAQKMYNEIMVRYIVGYSNFSEEEIYRTGFSKLIHYPEYHDVEVLATSMALFENAYGMRLLLRDCAKHNCLRFWIGQDLIPYAKTEPNCTVAATPYLIGQQVVGSIGILGPVCMPYPQLFGILKAFASSISEALTRNLYKYKIHYRQPHSETHYLGQESPSRLILLEDKREGA